MTSAKVLDKLSEVWYNASMDFSKDLNLIHLITKSNLKECFDLVVSGLSRALDKTSLGNNWSLEALYEGLDNLDVYAFHLSDSQYSGVFSINHSPKGKTLYFFWSGKDVNNTTPVNYEVVDTLLLESAKHFGASEIICEGRKGWKPILLPLGYSEDSVNYIKEVKYELPPI